MFKFNKRFKFNKFKINKKKFRKITKRLVKTFKGIATEIIRRKYIRLK